MSNSFRIYNKTLPLVAVAVADLSSDGIVVVNTVTTPDKEFVAEVAEACRQIYNDNNYRATATPTKAGWMYFVYDANLFSFKEACSLVQSRFAGEIDL
jgi:hypothetical protein